MKWGLEKLSGKGQTNMKVGFFLMWFPMWIMILSTAGCPDDQDKRGEIRSGVTTEETGVSGMPGTQELDGLRIHFKKPPNWGAPRIYVYGEHGATVEEYTGPWPGKRMEPEGNDWYVLTLRNLKRANVIFTDGNSQIPPAEWPSDDFVRDRGEWWYDGSWHDKNPEAPQGMK